MKTPRDRAVEIAHEVFGQGFSRPAFLRLVEEDCEGSAGIRAAIEILTKGVEADRRDVAAETAPS